MTKSGGLVKRFAPQICSFTGIRLQTGECAVSDVSARVARAAETLCADSGYPFLQAVDLLFRLLTFLTLSTTLAAADFESVTIGFDGQGCVGEWLPITARATSLPAGKTAILQTEFTDPAGNLCVDRTIAQVIPDDGQATLQGLVRIGRLAGTGTVKLVIDDEVVSEYSVTYSESADEEQTLRLATRSQTSFLTVGEVTGFERFIDSVRSRSGESAVGWYQLTEAAELPVSLQAYDAVDYVLLADDFSLSEQQQRVLRGWVRNGGRLIVSSGNSIPELLRTPLGAWMASRFELAAKPQGMRLFTSLVSFVPGAAQISTNQVWSVAAVKNRAVTALVDSSNGPIISRVSEGAGWITLIGMDVNERPISVWKSLHKLYEVLFFGDSLSGQKQERHTSRRISGSGMSDIGTQMLAAVDAVPDGGSRSAWSVMSVLFAWLLLIGPLDYFLVTRVLKKPHLTWVTFPILIIVAIALIYPSTQGSGSYNTKQLHLIDVSADGADNYVRTRSWSSISSPETRKAEISSTPSLLTGLSAENVHSTLTWQGRAEDAYGAMYRPEGISLGKQQFVRAASEELAEVPLFTDGSLCLVGESHASVSEPVIKSDLLAAGYGALTGTFSHELPGEISDWVIAFHNRIYQVRAGGMGELGVLSAGEVWSSSDKSLGASDLKSWLTGARMVVADEGKHADLNKSTLVLKPYDRKSQDLLDIVRMMSFYDVVTSTYVNLDHHQFRQLKLTDAIELNRAVLIGRFRKTGDSSDFAASDLQIDGSSVDAERTTIVRLILPVQTQQNDGDEPKESDE